MKNKTFNFRCSKNLNDLILELSKLEKYKSIGILTKSDLLRYYFFKGLEKDNKGILKEFLEIVEIKEHLSKKIIKINNSTYKQKLKHYDKN